MRPTTPSRTTCAPAILVAAALLIAGCAALPTPQFPSADAFVASELAAIPAAGRFDYSILDFSGADERPRTVVAGGVEFTSVTASIGFSIGRRIVGDEAPVDGTFLGSPEHLRLAAAGSVILPGPATVLGIHAVLSRQGVGEHRWLPAGTEARLLVTGLDRAGGSTGTVKWTPASTGAHAVPAAESWSWVDLSELGEVAGLQMTFESPVSDLPVLLIDNVTLSTEFRPDPDYFTVALLPSTLSAVADYPEVLDSQVRYLADTAQSDAGEPIVFVSHLGNIVPPGSGDAEWQRIDEAFGLLDGLVPYGIAPGVSDWQDPDDPPLGAPGFLAHFPANRLSAVNPRSGFSEDGYSSFQIVDTPVGDLLAFQLAADIPQATGEWAQQVMDANRGTPTLVTTAAYFNELGRDRRSAPVLRSAADSPPGLSPQDLWENLLRPNSQVFLVATGDGPGEDVRIEWNRAGQPVVEMLVSYGRRPEGGEGYLRLLRFYPGRSELRIITYSPWLDTYEEDLNSFLRLPLDISGRIGLE